MEAPQTDAIPLTPEALAAKDAELLSALQQRTQERMSVTTDQPEKVLEPKVPMNRAQRRQQVALYARVLAETERQTPTVHPTIVPKAKRRRRKGG